MESDDLLSDAISGVNSAVHKLDQIYDDDGFELGEVSDDVWNLRVDIETIRDELEDIMERLKSLKEVNKCLNQ